MGHLNWGQISTPHGRYVLGPQLEKAECQISTPHSTLHSFLKKQARYQTVQYGQYNHTFLCILLMRNSLCDNCIPTRRNQSRRKPLLRKSSTSCTTSNGTLLTTFSIIAVHGLNPRSKDDATHAWDSWRTPKGKKGHLWLREDLPSIVPESRIFLYEYNATVVYGKDQGTFISKANELLEAIRIERDETNSARILFLGHSMGGILIKQALVNAFNNQLYTSIKDATTGLAFFATPHFGAKKSMVTLGGVAAEIALHVGFEAGDNVIEVLRDSMFSVSLQEMWKQQLLEYQIRSFWGDGDNVSRLDSRSVLSHMLTYAKDRRLRQCYNWLTGIQREPREAEGRPQNCVQV